MLIFPTLRLNDKHKFVPLLKRFLNELVQPSPNLPLNDIVDDKTIKAVRLFKIQWIPRVLTISYDTKNYNEITIGLWAMIGRALSKDRLLQELRNATDHEVRSLLVGIDITGILSKYYTAEMEKCDAKIASILGGDNAIAASNGFEPDSLALTRQIGGRYSYYRGDTIQNNQPTIGHLSAYIMHLYGSTDRTRFGVDGKTSTDVYVPDGFEKTSSNGAGGKQSALTQIPTSTEAVVTFYYKKLGNAENVTLMLMHIKNFKPVKKGDRWHIGQIGGKGGGVGDITQPYLHSHFELVKGDVGLASQFTKNKYDGDKTREFRTSIGVRFIEAFC